jgi:hypothetical protein
MLMRACRPSWRRTRPRSGRPCPCRAPAALLADVGRDLADDLLVVALDDHAGRLGHLELDARRRLDVDRVRVAERELEVAALERGAVADALQLQALLEALGDALDHVGHERARQAVQAPVLAAVGRARDGQDAVLLLDADVAALALGQRAARAGDVHDLRLDHDGDAEGTGMGLRPMRDMGYQTSATTSPPTFCRRAS